MGTTVIRKPASFRFQADLLDTLKSQAKKCNCSLNNYVESLLLDVVYNEPNAETKAAIEEARSEKKKETFDSVESLMKELMK